MPTPLVPEIRSGPAMLVAGIRRRHRYADAAHAIPAQWRELRRTGPLPGARPGTAYGVVCASHGEGFEYLAGVEVDAFEALPAGTGHVRVPAARYAVFAHTGHVSELTGTWERIWKEWLPASGLTAADTPDFERYGPAFDPETGEGGLEIWFPVAP